MACESHDWRYYLTCCPDPRPTDPCTPPFRQCLTCCVVDFPTAEEEVAAQEEREEAGDLWSAPSQVRSAAEVVRHGG